MQLCVDCGSCSCQAAGGHGDQAAGVDTCLQAHSRNMYASMCLYCMCALMHSSELCACTWASCVILDATILATHARTRTHAHARTRVWIEQANMLARPTATAAAPALAYGTWPHIHRSAHSDGLAVAVWQVCGKTTAAFCMTGCVPGCQCAKVCRRTRFSRHFACLNRCGRVRYHVIMYGHRWETRYRQIPMPLHVRPDGIFSY